MICLLYRKHIETLILVDNLECYFVPCDNKISVMKTHLTGCFYSVKHCTCKIHWIQLVYMVNMLTINKTHRKACFLSVKHNPCKTHWKQLDYIVYMFIIRKINCKACFHWLFETLFYTMFSRNSVKKTHWKAFFHRIKLCTCKSHWTQLLTS